MYGSGRKGIERECFPLVQDLEHLVNLLARQLRQNRVLDEFLDGQNLSDEPSLFATVKYQSARDNIIGHKCKGRSKNGDIGELELVVDVAEGIELSTSSVDGFGIESHMVKLYFCIGNCKDHLLYHTT
jgi:hypothetical protein